LELGSDALFAAFEPMIGLDAAGLEAGRAAGATERFGVCVGRAGANLEACAVGAAFLGAAFGATGGETR